MEVTFVSLSSNVKYFTLPRYSWYMPVAMMMNRASNCKMAAFASFE